MPVYSEVVGFVIYQRTTARARQLELEEEAMAAGLSEEGGYLVNPDEFGDIDHTMDDDDISLWDNEPDAYHDNFTDEQPKTPAVDVDEEASIDGKGADGPR